MQHAFDLLKEKPIHLSSLYDALIPEFQLPAELFRILFNQNGQTKAGYKCAVRTFFVLFSGRKTSQPPKGCWLRRFRTKGNVIRSGRYKNVTKGDVISKLQASVKTDIDKQQTIKKQKI